MHDDGIARWALDRAQAGEPLPTALDLDPAALAETARGAFWTNLYNALVLDALRRGGLTGDLRRARALFRRTGIEVGGLRCSLHEIEHGLLRGNRPAPWTFWAPLSRGDPRLRWQPARFDPRIHFALNCGARSCPPIRAYTAVGWEEQLQIATASYLLSESGVDPDGKVRLPWLLALYARDFPDPRAFTSSHGPEHVRTALAAGARTRWSAYDWAISER